MNDLFNLECKTAIVTGAGSGLGQRMCIALAEAGADILGVGRRNLDPTKKAVEQQGRKFVSVNADLLDRASITRIIETAEKEFGKFDILINNAGTIIREDAADYKAENWDTVINLNLNALFFLSQAACRHFMKNSIRGKIVNIASMLSYQGGIRVPAYTASKSAVLGLTRALANEWAKYGINVNGIAPGYMVTENTEQIRKDKARYESILDRIPAGRWGEPSDLDGAAVFLSSKASDYVNGFTLAVDGGWLAR